MNFLGHAYLSFKEPEILVGNMISDCVKGRTQYNFSEGIQKGIRLHRYIDHFTDTHPAIREAQEIFRPQYRLYSAPLVDVAFDHFLANDPEQFGNNELLTFSQQTYQTLDGFTAVLPPRFAGMFPEMKRHNWLYAYRTYEGISRSIRGLMYRASMADDGSGACALLLSEYQALQTCYNRFIGDVKHYAKARLEELNA